MKVTLYSLRCDEPLCRVEADLVGERLADVEARLVRHGRWSIERQAVRGGLKTFHYCPRCAARRAEQKVLDELIRAL